MPIKRWSSPRLLILFLFSSALLFLIGCGGAAVDDNANWVGVSAENSRIYIAYGGGVAAYDVNTQKTLWHLPKGSSKGFFAPPAVADGVVYVADFGQTKGILSPGVQASVYALQDTDTGNAPPILWQSSEVAKDRIIASPLVADDIVVIGTADNSVVALNKKDGQELWRKTLGHSIWAQPSYANGTVIVNSLDKSVYTFEAKTGEQGWKNPLSGALASKPLIIDQTVYVAGFDSMVHAFDIASGKEIWVFEAEDWIWQAPAVSGETLIFADAKAHVYAIDRQKGTLLWETQLEGGVEARVVVVDQKAIVSVVLGTTSSGQTGKLVALSAEKGETLWEQPVTYPIFTTPVVANNMIILTHLKQENSGFMQMNSSLILDGYSPTTGEKSSSYTVDLTNKEGK